MTKKLNLKFPAIIMLLSIMASLMMAGCSPVRRNLSKHEYTNCFSKTSKDLVAAEKAAEKIYGKDQTTVSKKKKKKISKKEKQKLLKEVGEYSNNTQKSLDTLKKYNTFTSYPSAVVSYCKRALAYEEAVQNEEPYKTLQKKYHKAAKQAIEVTKAGGFEKRAQTITKSVMLRDPHYTVRKLIKIDKKGHKHVVEDKKDKAKEKKKASQSKKPKIPKSRITFSLAQGIAIILVSILIIVVIFLQPNKSDDNMGALTATGGDSMFAKPKPRGYELFLIRATEFSIILLLAVILLAGRYRW